MTASPTLAEVRTWPAVVSVEQAAAALGCSRSGLYDRIRRGDAPVRTLTHGRRVVVVTASLVAVLEAP
ncbi:helix-turn-helix transcriptional regulator [Streptomyces massasporeus]